MDSVELPLPTKVEFGKVLAPAEGVDGAGTGGGGEVLRRCADADRRRGGDVKQHNQNADSYPSYRGKSTSLEVSVQKSFALGVKSENSVKRDHVGNDAVQSLHKQDSKMIAKKTIKLLDCPPCSKRPKLESIQTVRDTEAKRHDSTSQKNVPELLQGTPSEKSRLLKQKRVSDGRRIDKKNVRSGIRSKYDCFSSRAGLANFDSGFLGNTVLGAHGLKSDIRDITDHIENLSLSELLNGTYKYSSLGREKGKRILHTKDELLASIRKAFSMLSDMDYGKEANLILSPNLPSVSSTSSDVKEQCGDKPSSTKESSQINVCETSLRRPKDILSCLTLTQGQDLDSLLSPGSESSDTVKPHTPSMTASGASLPSFPWSHSQSVGHRPSVDSGKHGLSRCNSQWQWVRVGSSLTPLDDEDSSVHKIDDLLQEMDTVKLSIADSFEGRYNLCGTESTSGSVLHNIHSRKTGNVHGSQQLHHLENCDLSDGFQNHGNEDSLLRTPRVSSQAASPRTLRAAEILCDMRRSTDQWSAQGSSNGAIKWPKSPSEKAMKARKPSSPFGAAESSSDSRISDAAPSRSNQFSKKIIDRKNDSARLNNPAKGSIRWPVPIEDVASPVRSERGLMLDTRQPHGNGGRLPSQMSSQARLEKEYENQQKLRKATLTSSLGSAGDWNRERNRRM